MKDYIKDPVMYEFDKITEIPRPSHHEKEISDYLLNWAKANNLEAEQDEVNNVFIKVPATEDYENKSVIAMQAHMDMVCEKNENVEHDFLKDPIKYTVENNIVSTNNRTTLGADDGIGIALILAYLKSENPHPPLEIVFTVDEEDDFTGASNFDYSRLKAKYLINLDHAKEDEIICASAGGTGIRIFREFPEKKLNSEWKTFNISVRGFHGGHSGEDIEKGYGNSNIVLFRLLNSLDFKYRFLSIKGGSLRTAIPRESSAVIAVKEKHIDKLLKYVKEYEKKIKTEFEYLDSDFSVKAEECDNSSEEALSAESSREITDLVLLLPNGILEMSYTFRNTVKTSANVGEINLDNGKIEIAAEIRSLYNSDRDFVIDQYRLCSRLFHYDVELFSTYSSWQYNPDSKMKTLAKNIFEKELQEDVKTIALHAGLECGFFSENIDGIDIISIGPNCRYFHSPKEQFEFDSMQKIYKCLVNLLKEINF